MESSYIKLKNKNYKILIARELAEWKEGLKGEKIKFYDGLLMIFPDDRQVDVTGFGMIYDTDIFWIDSSGKVIKVLENMKALGTGKEFTKTLGVTCRYLLEIYSKKNIKKLLKVGDKLNIKKLKYSKTT